MIGTEIDPICALQVAMEGYQVTTMDEAASQGDIFVTATGNIDAITIDHMRGHMKDRASSATLAISTARSDQRVRGHPWKEVKPQVDEVVFPDGKRLVVLAKGRLVNLRCATGHPSFMMSAFFTNQVLAADRALFQPRQIREQGLLAAQAPRPEGHRLHLDKLGVKLTALSAAQARYLCFQLETEAFVVSRFLEPVSRTTPVARPMTQSVSRFGDERFSTFSPRPPSLFGVLDCLDRGTTLTM